MSKLDSFPIIFTKYLPTGDVRIGNQYILCGEGTDWEAIIFKLNLTEEDRKFLQAVHVQP